MYLLAAVGVVLSRKIKGRRKRTKRVTKEGRDGWMDINGCDRDEESTAVTRHSLLVDPLFNGCIAVHSTTCFTPPVSAANPPF